MCILGRGITLGRPLALLLSQKRPTANAAVTVVHTGVPDWPRVHAAGRRSWSRRRASPASSSPSTSRPARVVVGGGVRYEGRKLLPDVDEACEEVAGWITPRVGGVGPTTIAMLFRNAVEAAERPPAPEAERAAALNLNAGRAGTSATKVGIGRRAGTNPLTLVAGWTACPAVRRSSWR